MEPATILAIVILIIAILILFYYYLQSTNNPTYQNIHSQVSGITNRMGQEEYISNLSDKVNDISGKVKDRVQDEDTEEDHESKTDIISKRINQFLNEQSEQLIEDWDLVTNKDLDTVIEKYDLLEKDLNDYKKTNDNRVDDLESRLDEIDSKLNEIE